MDTYEVFVSSLSRPEAFPERGDVPILSAQTHASVVLLAGGLVYKLKKPKNFGFFDYTTPQQRRHFCLEEVRLNVRMAPQIYLGVAPVLISPEGKLHFGVTFRSEDLPEPVALVEGESVVDFAVVMVRLPDEATLEARVRDDKAEAPLLATIAYAGCRISPEGADSLLSTPHSSGDYQLDEALLAGPRLLRHDRAGTRQHPDPGSPASFASLASGIGDSLSEPSASPNPL